MNKGTVTREFVWSVPFLCVGLIALGLMRPKPTALPSVNGRTVVDAGGTEIQIEEPFRGIALTWGAWSVGWYLQSTHAPETVMNAGGPLARQAFAKRELLSKVFPAVLLEARYWDARSGDKIQRAKWDIEAAFNINPGVFLGNSGNFGMVPVLRHVGLPAMYLSSHPQPSNWDGVCYQVARVESALVGHPERGEAQIARYKQAFADIERELQPQTLAHRPRVLMMGSSLRDRGYFYLKSVKNDYQIYFPPAGIINASMNLTGDRQDAERILSMDPDIIFLLGSEVPREFLRDPRWRGLKAVQERRIYYMPGGGGLGGLIYQPIYDRWMAEIAHPDRLQPRVRQLLRDRFITEFNYRLSDDQIDIVLNVEENRGLPLAERFERNYRAANGLGEHK